MTHTYLSTFQLQGQIQQLLQDCLYNQKNKSNVNLKK